MRGSWHQPRHFHHNQPAPRVSHRRPPARGWSACSSLDCSACCCLHGGQELHGANCVALDCRHRRAGAGRTAEGGAGSCFCFFVVCVTPVTSPPLGPGPLVPLFYPSLSNLARFTCPLPGAAPGATRALSPNPGPWSVVGPRFSPR